MGARLPLMHFFLFATRGAFTAEIINAMAEAEDTDAKMPLDPTTLMIPTGYCPLPSYGGQYTLHGRSSSGGLVAV